MVASFPYSSDAYRVLVAPYHGDGAPKRGPGPVASSCYRLLAGLAHYAMSRRSAAPSESRRTVKVTLAVVAIGVDRHGDGRDNGVRWHLDRLLTGVCTTPVSTPAGRGNPFMPHSRSSSETSLELPTASHLVWGRVVPDIPTFCRELVAALAEE